MASDCIYQVSWFYHKMHKPNSLIVAWLSFGCPQSTAATLPLHCAITLYDSKL